MKNRETEIDKKIKTLTEHFEEAKLKNGKKRTICFQNYLQNNDLNTFKFNFRDRMFHQVYNFILLKSILKYTLIY